jgi:hypothetical protein
MRLTPPRVGEILAATFGVLLLVSLFLPWYRGRAGEVTISGFGAFAVVDIYLVVVAAGALALLVLETTQRTPAVAVAWAAILTPLAAVGAGLVLWRVLDPPGSGGAEPIFAYLGLLAATGVTVGTVMSMRDETQRRPASPEATARARPPEPLSAPSPGGDRPAGAER